MNRFSKAMKDCKKKKKINKNVARLNVAIHCMQKTQCTELCLLWLFPRELSWILDSESHHTL